MNTNIPYQNILITGGAGFIGSHLADVLVQQGCRVSIIDDLSTGREENLNQQAIFYRLNTTDRLGVRKIFKKESPELVFQLAANTNVPRSVQDPIFDLETLQGALNIIDACREFGAKKIIYVSSGFIYGNTQNRPTKESEPVIPISPYAISKKAIEHYLSFYKTVHKLSFALVRPATIYGPRQINGAMADYIRKLYQGMQAEIYGDGSKTRDYVFILDAINVLLALTNVPDNFVAPEFNLGTGKETSLNEVYFTIARLLGKIATPIYMPPRLGELDKYSLDPTKLRQALGWQPTYSLSDGLQLTLNHWLLTGTTK